MSSNVSLAVQAKSRFGVTLADLREVVRLADEMGFPDMSTIVTSGQTPYGGRPTSLVLKAARSKGDA